MAPHIKRAQGEESGQRLAKAAREEGGVSAGVQGEEVHGKAGRKLRPTGEAGARVWGGQGG